MRLDSPQRMPCAERSGFLFRHACAYDAMRRCDACGKAICQDHVQQVDPIELKALAKRRPEQKLEADRAELCISCAKKLAHDEQSTVHHHRRENDPFWYADSWYPGYYVYGPGHWSGAYSDHGQRGHDANDFTDADGTALRAEGDQAFEHDASGS